MNKAMKVLAIAMLLLTVAGACVVLYGMNTLAPRVEQVTVSRVRASEVPEAFEALLAQLDEGTFSGRLFGATDGLNAEDSWFETCTVRLGNMGFFPAEWVSLDVVPVASTDGGVEDVLQLADPGAYVLAAGSRGDLSATVLTTIPQDALSRHVRVTCYVLGREISFEATQTESSTGNGA